MGRKIHCSGSLDISTESSHPFTDVLGWAIWQAYQGFDTIKFNVKDTQFF
jgi:hypothetical protein